MLKAKILILALLNGFVFLNAQKNNSVSYQIQDKQFDSILEYLKKDKKYVYQAENSKKDVVLLNKLARTKHQKIKSLQLLAYVYNFTGKADSSGYYLEKRLELVKKYYPNTNDYYQAVIDYVNWGEDYVDNVILVDLLTKAMSTIDQTKNKRELGLMCMLLGDLFCKDNDFEKSEYYYDKFHKLFGNDVSKVDYYERKGFLNMKKGDFKQGKFFLENAIAVDKSENTYFASSHMIPLAYCNYRLKNFKEAKRLLEKTLSIQKKQSFSTLNSPTYLCLSFLEKLNKNYDAEKKYLDSAYENRSDDISVKIDIEKAYADYYSRTFDFDKENWYRDSYTKIEDSLKSIESQKTKLKLESLYRFKENKKRLALQQKILQKETLLKKIYLLSASVLFFFAIIIFWVLNAKFKTQRKFNENQMVLHEQNLKLMQENQRTEIIKEKIKAKMEERGKLSLELHDGIANEIASLKLSISGEKELDQEKIESIVNKVDKLYYEVRNLSHDLNPDNIADVEFSQLVDNLCLMTQKNGLKTEKNILISKNVDDLDENILINIYRILQEAVNNTIKHAAATEVKIDVIESDEELYFGVKDNGRGFINSGVKPGIGLKNIEKRVNLLNGSCKISNSTSGTIVDIRIPKNKLQMN